MLPVQRERRGSKIKDQAMVRMPQSSGFQKSSLTILLGPFTLLDMLEEVDVFDYANLLPFKGV